MCELSADIAVDPLYLGLLAPLVVGLGGILRFLQLGHPLLPLLELHSLLLFLFLCNHELFLDSLIFSITVDLLLSFNQFLEVLNSFSLLRVPCTLKHTVLANDVVTHLIVEVQVLLDEAQLVDDILKDIQVFILHLAALNLQVEVSYHLFEFFHLLGLLLSFFLLYS